MSYSYVLGNLVGRCMMSFVLVWIVCLVSARLDWRRAFVLSRRWYALLATVCLALLGLGAALGTAGAH